MRLLLGIVKNTLIGGGALACYWKTKQGFSLEEKPLSPSPSSSLSPSLHDHKKESYKFLAPFAVGEAPYYSHSYKGAIISSLPYLVSLQQLWGAPGIEISVRVKGELVWSQAFGYADVENAVPLSTQSRIRVASISKAFTSAAVGLLYEEGKLDLDAPIQTYLPDFPLFSPPITPRYLASHLSGIRHYSKDLSEFFSTTNYASVNDALEVVKGYDFLTPPGAKYNYSTFGYTILSAVLEKASGQTYLKLMQEKVFEPLGMLHTVHDEHNKVIPHRARHYQHKAPLQNSPYVDVSNKWAGGGFLSTADDVARFGSAMLRGGLLLKPETIRILFSPQQTTDGTLTKYGLGWDVSSHIQHIPEEEGALQLPKGVVISHGGGAVGASSMLLMLPNSEVVVAIVMNVQDVEGLRASALRIAKTFERSSY